MYRLFGSCDEMLLNGNKHVEEVRNLFKKVDTTSQQTKLNKQTKKHKHGKMANDALNVLERKQNNNARKGW